MADMWDYQQVVTRVEMSVASTVALLDSSQAGLMAAPLVTTLVDQLVAMMVE
jgi:hypothetical protein